jgi:iron complex outermembrane receptor protein
VGVQFGSFGRKQIQADLTGPLTADGSLVVPAGRAAAQVRHAGRLRARRPQPDRPFAHLAAERRHLAHAAGPVAEGQERQQLAVPALGGHHPVEPERPPAGSRFIGEPGDFYDSERKTFGWLFEHKFNDNWTVRQNFRYAQNENDNQLPLRRLLQHVRRLVQRPGLQAPARPHLRQPLTLNRIPTLDNHVEGHFHTGALKHTLLVGAEFRASARTSGAARPYSTIDAYAPVYGIATCPSAVALPRTTQRNAGLYVQDQIKLDNWIFVAGLRHDQGRRQRRAATREDQRHHQALGRDVRLPSGWSPYVSYTESFTPQSAAPGASFKPLRGEQWEAGVKYEPKDRALAFSAAVYDLREKNQIVEEQPTCSRSAASPRTRASSSKPRARSAATWTWSPTTTTSTSTRRSRACPSTRPACGPSTASPSPACRASRPAPACAT